VIKSMASDNFSSITSSVAAAYQLLYGVSVRRKAFPGRYESSLPMIVIRWVSFCCRHIEMNYRSSQYLRSLPEAVLRGDKTRPRRRCGTEDHPGDPTEDDFWGRNLEIGDGGCYQGVSVQ
jgi:hypothetical protein